MEDPFDTDFFNALERVSTNPSSFSGMLEYFQVKKPMYSSHISVVRNEVPPNLNMWGKYQGVKISFEYEPFIYGDELYYWLNAYSSILEDVRVELGLPNISDITVSPDRKCKFHITIGNTKHLR